LSFNEAVFGYNSNNLSFRFCKGRIIPWVHKSLMTVHRGH
jgi:hypothetical protein